MALDNEDFRNVIDNKRIKLEEKYALVMVAARKIVNKHDELISAEENRDMRGESKDVAKYEIAEGEFNSAVKKFFFFLSDYDTAVEEILAIYSQNVTVACAKDAKKLRAEAERFEDCEHYNRDRLLDITRQINGIDEMYSEYIAENAESGMIDDEKIDQSEETFNGEMAYDGARASSAQSFESDSQSSYRQQQASPRYEHYAQDSYNIMPAKIDISKIVEEAIASAMSKFNSVLERRMNNADVKTSVEQNAAPLSDDTVNIHNGLVEFEVQIAKKLSELTETLKQITDDMTVIGAEYIKISDNQKQITENQMKINAVQSALLSEFKDIHSLQHQISEQQIAASAEQAALAERQKLTLENQTVLNSQQTEITSLHESLLKAEGVIVESSKDMLDYCKSIIDLQRETIAAANKNLDLQRSLTAKQNEINALQKQAVAEHKQAKKRFLK